MMVKRWPLRWIVAPRISGVAANLRVHRPCEITATGLAPGTRSCPAGRAAHHRLHTEDVEEISGDDFGHRRFRFPRCWSG